MKFLIDTDKIPYTFYEECGKSLHTDADARWLSEKKCVFMALLMKYKFTVIDYTPFEKWICVYCNNTNHQEHNSCCGCGAPISSRKVVE